jgi:hypothetical protein
MESLVKETQDRAPVEPIFFCNEMKSKLTSPVAAVTACTCSTLHMAVHDAMCPGCWARLSERVGH